MNPSNPSAPADLPVVVSLGFAGSRQLLDPTTKLNETQKEVFYRATRDKLAEHLAEFRVDLGLDSRHFFCGVSQIAIGADTLFTEVCQEKSIAQRFFLPQPRDEYLRAVNSQGEPDFTPEQRGIAEQWFKSPHLIQVRVVSEADSRAKRFEEVSYEILSVSEVVVCLLRKDAEGRPGGTDQFLEGALRRGKPVLEIRVAERDGQPVFDPPVRHNYGAGSQSTSWKPPALPDGAHAFAPSSNLVPPSPGIPMGIDDYLAGLKKTGSEQAELKRNFFRRAAFFIIGAHLCATAFAGFALMTKDHHDPIVRWCLGAELLLLLIGCVSHVILHNSHAVRVWAMSRLVAEVARSVKAMGKIHVHLGYLFVLPFPPLLRPLLRTVNVIHLASTRTVSGSWEGRRDLYLSSRLDGPNGQIVYYEKAHDIAECQHKLASGIFYLCTAVAFAASLAKLLIVSECFSVSVDVKDTAPGWLGLAAILLPAIAVGVLSLAASFDLEARVNTYEEILDYLRPTTRNLIANAGSETEFTRLALETEARLLGETANWASRRSFTSVN